MNSLKYGEVAVGAPYSQARFEALCLDLRKVDPSTRAWNDYAEEIARDYPGFTAIIHTENGTFCIRALNGALRVELV
jgi:hypothetical protein